jgi:predicted DNA-binding WGR domain protein/DNA polymerase III delta prime subunit
MADDIPLLRVMEAGLAQGGLQTDDVLALALPLLRQVAALHAAEQTCDIPGVQAIDVLEGGALGLRNAQGHAPRLNRDAVERLQAPVSSVLQVVGESRITQDSGHFDHEDLALAPDEVTGDALKRPVYVPGYRCWEQLVDHNDAVTDIFCLGQVLASLSCDLDFRQREHLGQFVRHRDNLFALQPRLHPVVASVIVEMTELDRRRRAKDLPSLIARLETYREQPQDLAIDRVLADDQDAGRRQRAIQAHLRDRLFDLSRRNRLLYFRPTQASVNLTMASVPLVVDLKSIRVDQLCVWDGRFARAIAAGDKVLLANWLRFEDQPYLPASLDRIIQDDRRDRAEFGLSQLSLVLAFLRWHNLKEARDERIVSPLLLLSVELTRKKGVRDQYVLQAQSSEAEVNPVLRHQLHTVYGIELPETVELADGAIEAFHRSLQEAIAHSEPGVRLQLVDKPEIEVIHQRVRQRLEQFGRRRKASIRPATPLLHDGDYSYAPDDYRPLGLKLFHERVRPAALPLRDAVGAAPTPRHPHVLADAAADAERTQTTFAMRERTGNPYEWDLDLTSVTLGNFNYRKMSLVRDYNALVDGDLTNEAFGRVFSLKPRALEDRPPPSIALGDRWSVVKADATQMAAVALARSRESYIIQGPPGTGKSQTITNLIADYVGRGYRVLFVCEKRAAIDVVFHRLKRQQLGELCCMIHDSQSDKKSFVMDLRQTYEDWLGRADGADALANERSRVAELVQQDIDALGRFDTAMRETARQTDLPVHHLIRRLVALAPAAVELPLQIAEMLPGYAAWQAHGGLAQRIERTVREVLSTRSLAGHVFARLNGQILCADEPLGHLLRLVDAAEPLIDQLADTLAPLGPVVANLDWAGLQRLADFIQRMEPLGASVLQGLLDADSEESRTYTRECGAVDAAVQQLHRSQERTVHWREKLTAQDATQALVQARQQEPAFSRWFSPGWWRLRVILMTRYHFAAHAVRPSFVQVLQDLTAEHEAGAALDAARRQFAARYGMAVVEDHARALNDLRSDAQGSPVLREFTGSLRASGFSMVTLTGLARYIMQLSGVLAQFLGDVGSESVDRLGEIVRDLRESADSLPELLPLLRELSDIDPVFARTMRTLDLPAAGIECAIAREELERIYRAERWLPRFDVAALARHAERIGVGEKRLLQLNAQVVRALVQQRFRENVLRSMLATSQLDDAGKQFKKSYSAGRRELEHEFGKTMRYKSIREMASGDTGQVVRDMKPIWLMSPLSVSDTLPMTGGDFDVVIFDEASQIPVEEAVPALYRAPQVIIVGDEMQLPPTSFFSSSRSEEDESVTVEGDEGERLSVVLDADSLLNQGARNLPATMLAWHYRSRSESLIGFSNAAFYGGNLYTIPDRRFGSEARLALTVRADQAQDLVATEGAQALLSRPLSLHHLPDAVYEERRNEAEAAYIAAMTRELLLQETGKSIGIVAFSEAQQSAIEAALDALAAADPSFGARLEAEYAREEDDQFCGLFVKNLENVQGDERDIIILSICYGPGPAPARKVMMNFGPINQRGGEKRLNVIFSRARHHMAVVTSLRHEAITNDYNDGAAALKQFLRYAGHASCGEAPLAQAVLEGMNPATRRALTSLQGGDGIVAQIAEVLRQRGHAVDEYVGQSRFRCELAVRDPATGQYRLGILVDTEAQYANGDVHERYVSRPGILDAFGWQTVQVLTKDWLRDRDAVIDQVERCLRNGKQGPDDSLAREFQSKEIPAVEATRVSSGITGQDEGLESFRRLEHVEGGSRKFWSIGRRGTEVVITFGRIDSRGQTQIKQFDSEVRAEREIEKLAAEKVRKGYTDSKPGDA